MAGFLAGKLRNRLAWVGALLVALTGGGLAVSSGESFPWGSGLPEDSLEGVQRVGSIPEWEATFENSAGEGFCNYTLSNFTGTGYARLEPCTGMIPMMSDIAHSMSRAWRATSVSSHSCTQGLKTFTLQSGGSALDVNAPVRISKEDSFGEVMEGRVKAVDRSLGEVTIDVDSVTCSGSSTDWTLYMANYRTETVASPVPISDGGTGSTTAPAARAALAIPGMTEVLGWLSDPPVSPSTGDAYLVGPAPTGAWAGRESDLAIWSGSSWTLSTPAVGDLVVGPFVPGLNGTQVVYRSVSVGGLGQAGLWFNSAWTYTTHAPESWPGIYEPSGAAVSSSPLLGNTTLTDTDVGDIVLVDLSGSSLTVTLPAVGSASGQVPPGRAFRFLVVETGAAVVTVEAASGRTINGGASVTLPNSIGLTTTRAVNLAGLGTFDWYVE